ncbi:MAG: amidohydrolase [Acidobacteriota bacterium]|nr:amidohydrolase [Acidobacteriota bacterium]
MRTILLTLLSTAIALAQADLILRNGNIVTMEAAHPSAQAIAVRGGKILAVGSDAEMKALTGPKTRVIDLGGKLAIPGFIEGHGHFMGVGQYKMNLNLRNARNWDEIVAMVADAAKKAPPGAWILGRGWHQSKWDKTPTPNVQGFPVHADLSKVSPNNPVWLTHASGHACMVNAQALKQAEITAKTADPVGGQILKDAQGQPTGLLQERAQQLLSPAYKAYTSKKTPVELEAEARKQIELATDECLSNGITTFQDAGSSLETIDLFKQEAEAGELRLRLWVMIRDSYNALAKGLPKYRMIDVGDGHLTVRAIKRQMDGALGSRGAWLIEPYSDLPSSTGLNTEPIAEIRKAAELAIANGFQLCIHAIGDRANREVLNLYESVFREHPDKADPRKNELRWRDEHTQHLNPADIPRFAKLGVIASMQAIHCTSDAPYVLPRLGPQRAKEGAYVWRSLIDSGAIVTNGTDAPVEEVSPIASFYAAVSRKLKDGTRFYPEQRMTREEALRSYTLNNAYAAFEEKSKGSLAPGKLADITVLSKDIMTVPEDEIPATQVLYTIVGGKIAYAAPSLK